MMFAPHSDLTMCSRNAAMFFQSVNCSLTFPILADRSVDQCDLLLLLQLQDVLLPGYYKELFQFLFNSLLTFGIFSYRTAAHWIFSIFQTSSVNISKRNTQTSLCSINIHIQSCLNDLFSPILIIRLNFNWLS